MIKTENKRLLSTPRAFAILIVALCYMVLWIGGVANHLFRIAENKDYLAALFLSLATALILLSTKVSNDVLLLVLIALFGFAAEVFGVHFGFPFGSYHYTETLQPKLLGVPLVMGLAWLNLVAYIKQMLLPFKLNLLVQALVGGVWMTLIDLIIDPLAANQLGYWRWYDSGFYYGVPAINFAGWFITSFIIFLIFNKELVTNEIAKHIGISIVLFFTLLAFSYALYTVALIGCGLFIIHIVIGIKARV